MSEPTWNPMSQQYEVGDSVTGPNGEKWRVLAEAMPVLPAFLLARIDEDEAVARAAQPSVPPLVHRDDAAGEAYLLRFGAGRILRECEAKRRIIGEYKMCDERVGAGYALGALSRSLRALALPYSSHPDYDEAWRP